MTAPKPPPEPKPQAASKPASEPASKPQAASKPASKPSWLRGSATQAGQQMMPAERPITNPAKTILWIGFFLIVMLIVQDWATVRSTLFNK